MLAFSKLPTQEVCNAAKLLPFIINTMTNQKTKQNYLSDNFFEAIRDLGTKSSKKPASKKPLSGEIQPNQFQDFEAQLLERERQTRAKERTHFEYVKRQERLVFSRKQEEIKAQIEAIQEELKKLIEEAGGLAQEVEVAVEQVVVNPGVYHLNFFDKLRQLMILLRKKVADSKTWMHATNSRAKSRSFFWGQVGKSGTKFLLSQERYMSTQAG